MGKNWAKLGSGLPDIPVRDIKIQKRENDLVIATFGRGFYILDDYTLDGVKGCYVDLPDPEREFEPVETKQIDFITIVDDRVFIEHTTAFVGRDGHLYLTSDQIDKLF